MHTAVMVPVAPYPQNVADLTLLQNQTNPTLLPGERSIAVCNDNDPSPYGEFNAAAKETVTS
jgi:hypothetical protein